MIAQSLVCEINIRLLFLLAITTIPIMTTKAQAPGPTPAPAQQTTPAPPAPSAADVATMDSTIASLYDVISGPPGARNWDRFRSLFAPGARLIANGVRPTGEVVSRVMTVEDYAQRNGPFFEKNGFFEQEAARSMDSIQLMNDGKRWWIVTIFWQGEDEKNRLPDKYLKRNPETIN